MFRTTFNCCKSYPCHNLGIANSPEYQMESNHLGYPAIHCRACGSYPPLVDDATVAVLLEEKLGIQFGQPLTGCTHCENVFFIAHAKAKQGENATKRYGHTSAGQQRLKCGYCQKVYSLKLIKQVDKLERLLHLIAENKSTTDIIDQLACAPKIYYQLLAKLADILRSYARLNEQALLQSNFLALHTESGLLRFAGDKTLWCLATTEAQSGYCLLYNHNLLLNTPANTVYEGKASSILPEPKVPSILAALTARYQSTMRRPHFEALHYGLIAPLRGADYVKPSTLSYAHFQLLRMFCQPTKHFHHYIEHESAIRGAALMASSDEIKAEQAEVFFVYRHFTGGKELPSNGNNIGWWSDRWYGTHYGAYCPITYRNKYPVPFSLFDANGPKKVHQWIQDHQAASLKSAKSLDASIEIQRNIYNYCQLLKTADTPAMRMGFTKQALSLSDLLNKAVAAVECGHG
ncbi:hypothetical protein K6Y31_16105 [Motilimonas cestriensis]|uniref:Cytoplasmic protein n=1 Tax=Motilimonas cestriensis TaxID=2742685 RepID=A0ABS8WDI0_9GAMM|nr:hypothetical protein [Motilimonas cestriensis]MCE2596325.1 hypothetical protein [Motilimonas cestriensis]